MEGAGREGERTAHSLTSVWVSRSSNRSSNFVIVEEIYEKGRKGEREGGRGEREGGRGERDKTR